MAREFNYPIFLGALLALVLTGCGDGGSHADLHAFMGQARVQPKGEIEPLPVFASYTHFPYSAMAMRSPFDAPFTLDELAAGARTSKAPDEKRPREPLEAFNFSSFSMRGGLRGADGVQWALVGDGKGGVYRVTLGNYIGRNHGRIVSVTDERLDVIEIVPDGRGGWLERPRTLSLD